MIKIPKDLKIIDSDFFLGDHFERDEILLFVLRNLNEISGFYPEFYEWLQQKVMPGLISGERKIIIEHYRGKLAGVAIIKDSFAEQKLCCLRVLPEFQGSGVGLRLFERSFEELNNCSPLLSIAEEQIDTFKKVFKYYGFTHSKTYKDYYRPRKNELSFNGLIEIETSFETHFALKKITLSA